MKIKQKTVKNSKKRIVLLAIVVFAVIAGILVFAVLPQLAVKTDGSNDNLEITKKSESPNKDEPDTTSQEPTDKKQTSNTDQPIPPVQNEKTKKMQVQMVSSHNINPDIIYIRGGINNSVEYSGTCSVILNGPDGQVIEKNTTLLQNSATTDCKTISISTSELLPGLWRYKLIYSSATTEGSSDEKSFSI